jgi:glycerol-1-phosphate dehydrogenase [NAD(P)+]
LVQNEKPLLIDSRYCRQYNRYDECDSRFIFRGGLTMLLNREVQKKDIEKILKQGGFNCGCGKYHSTAVKDIVVSSGAAAQVPALIEKHTGKKAFLLSDLNTYEAAGKGVEKHLDDAGISYTSFVFQNPDLEPDDRAVGQAALYFDTGCDIILGIGSGTINDIGKMLAKVTGCKYIVVCTAPSMDGYASATSSMIRDGIKVSLPSVCPCAVAADLDIISKAPVRLLQAGLGDMLAKYISLCEWRISNVITGEFYCEEIASMVRSSLRNCISASAGLKNRDPEAVKVFIEGLILAGLAMSFAESSRPASGIEHYFSHLWEMRALQFHTPVHLHGIQCGVATVLALHIYEFIKTIRPCRQKALNYVRDFSIGSWNRFIVSFLGSGASPLMELEKTEGKYDKQKHRERLEVILSKWDEVLKVITEELPSYKDVERMLTEAGAPVNVRELGHSGDCVRDAFMITKDIRDKYIASRLLWDLGFLDEAGECLKQKVQ